jgi:hypothetical protein
MTYSAFSTLSHNIEPKVICLLFFGSFFGPHRLTSQANNLTPTPQSKLSFSLLPPFFAKKLGFCAGSTCNPVLTHNFNTTADYSRESEIKQAVFGLMPEWCIMAGTFCCNCRELIKAKHRRLMRKYLVTTMLASEIIGETNIVSERS